MKRICYLLLLLSFPIALFYYAFFFPSQLSLIDFFPYATIIDNRIKLRYFQKNIIMNLIICKSSCCPRIYEIIHHEKTNYTLGNNTPKFERLSVNHVHNWLGYSEIYIQLTRKWQINTYLLFVLISLSRKEDCPSLFDP